MTMVAPRAAVKLTRGSYFGTIFGNSLVVSGNAASTWTCIEGNRGCGRGPHFLYSASAVTSPTYACEVAAGSRLRIASA